MYEDCIYAQAQKLYTHLLQKLPDLDIDKFAKTGIIVVVEPSIDRDLLLCKLK